MTTKTAAELWREIEESATKRNIPETRDVRGLCDVPGDVVRQGDVYLVVVPTGWPHGDLRGDRQVAVGTTVGSRHVAVGEAVRVFAAGDSSTVRGALRALGHPTSELRDYQVGPVCVATADWTLTHPEHAHIVCGPGSWQVIYQRDPRMDRAVQD